MIPVIDHPIHLLFSLLYFILIQFALHIRDQLSRRPITESHVIKCTSQKHSQRLMGRYAPKWLSTIVVLCLFFSMPLNSLAINKIYPSTETIHIIYSFPTPNIETIDEAFNNEEDIQAIQEIQGDTSHTSTDIEYVSVTMGDLPLQSEPGSPILPVKSAAILLPYRTTVQDITVINGNKISAAGSYIIQPGQEPYALSNVSQSVATPPNPLVYNTNGSFPVSLYSNVMIQKKDGFHILLVTLHPIEYTPNTGTVSYYDKLELEVTLKRVSNDNLFGSFEDTELVQDMVDNPSFVETYPTSPKISDTYESHLDPNSYEYVIITSSDLEATPPPYNLQSLQDDKVSRGISTTIVTTEWIYDNYSGTRPDGNSDDQTRIRNFIIDAYNTWGTKYVLLGGDGDGEDMGSESGDVVIPRRGFTVQGTYSDTCIPADIYYACLDGTFDHDEDGQYGEPTDGEDGGMPDLFAEVYVGRACVDSTTEVQNFVRKTLSYQNTSESDGNLRKVLMVGEHLGFGGVSEYAAESMDEIKEGSNTHGYTTIGFENSDYASLFDISTLYDADSTWAQDSIMGRINNNVHIINHLGHAGTINVMKMNNSTVDSLVNEELYFIGYSQGCYSGSFDNRDTGSTSYGSRDCVSEHLTTESSGAVAFISNSRYGWGAYHSTDGPSQHFNREFWDAVLSEDITNIGKANQDSKEDNAWRASSWVERWCIYEINLFGDPELSIKVRNPSTPEVTVLSPNGGEYLAGETVTSITWTATDTDMGDYPISIQYYNGSTWATIATDEANDGSYDWVTPDIETSSALIKVSATDIDSNVGYDISDSMFAIDNTPPTVTLTSPAGGETLIGGTTHTILWASAVDTNLSDNPITLQYSNSSSWTTIATGEANDGSYDWIVPQINTTTASVRVIAVDKAGLTYQHQSQANFTIDSPPTVTVTNPNGGESYIAGNTYEINWTVTDINLVSTPITIEYYSGVSWILISADEANDGSYLWTVPNILGERAS
ncbi:MAG: C25 family cysteine peptidase [Chloroflexota bacterium]|nr:C25 family cysteine peptidase [Chloroflexota bacterium]